MSSLTAALVFGPYGTAINVPLAERRLSPASRRPCLIPQKPTAPHNLEPWDGYPANPKQLLQSVKSPNQKLVALSVESHNSGFTTHTALTTLSAKLEILPVVNIVGIVENPCGQTGRYFLGSPVA